MALLQPRGSHFSEVTYLDRVVVVVVVVVTLIGFSPDSICAGYDSDDLRRGQLCRGETGRRPEG